MRGYVKKETTKKMKFLFRQHWLGPKWNSQIEKGFGFDWRLTIKRVDRHQYDLIIKCNRGSFSNIWELSCLMDLEVTGCVTREVKKVEKKFDSSNNSMTIRRFFESGLSNPSFSSVAVNLRVKMLELVGIPKTYKFDFENKHGITSDAKLFVPYEHKNEEKELYVSKSLLSLYSSVLREMFLKMEHEKKPAEIKMDEDYYYWNMLLTMIYPPHALPEEWYTSDDVKADDVGQILAIVDKYKIEFVKSKIEEYLISNKKILPFWKLRFAEMHALDLLMNDCLQTITTSKEGEKMMENGDFHDVELSDKTKCAVYQRILRLRFAGRYDSSSNSSSSDED